MWYLAAVFFIVPLVAIAFGFGGSTVIATDAAKVVFYLCLLLAAASLLPTRRAST